MIHKHFEPNTFGTDYVVGDIHGCYATFMAALDKINFNPAYGDRMFSVGDLVDRGEHSFSCYKLLDLPYFHAVRGNHEQMPIDYLDNSDFAHRHYAQTYSANGGDWFLDLHPDLQKVIADKFRELPIVITVGDVAIVHADPVYPDFNRLLDALNGPETHAEYIHERAIWGRVYVYEDDVNIEGCARMFLGHTPQVSGPKTVGNMHFIDTGSVFGHTLTICKLDGTVAVSEPNIDGRYKSKYFR